MVPQPAKIAAESAPCRPWRCLRRTPASFLWLSCDVVTSDDIEIFYSQSNRKKNLSFFNLNPRWLITSVMVLRVWRSGLETLSQEHHRTPFKTDHRCRCIHRPTPPRTLEWFVGQRTGTPCDTIETGAPVQHVRWPTATRLRTCSP